MGAYSYAQLDMCESALEFPAGLRACVSPIAGHRAGKLEASSPRPSSDAPLRCLKWLSRMVVSRLVLALWRGKAIKRAHWSAISCSLRSIERPSTMERVARHHPGHRLELNKPPIGRETQTGGLGGSEHERWHIRHPGVRERPIPNSRVQTGGCASNCLPVDKSSPSNLLIARHHPQQPQQALLTVRSRCSYDRGLMLRNNRYATQGHSRLEGFAPLAPPARLAAAHRGGVQF